MRESSLFRTEPHMRVSLIITTYNWKTALAVVLGSALRQTRLPDEIIVADDGSGDGTGEMVREIAGQAPVAVRHVWQEDKGFRAARSRNQAIAASTGDYLILVDGDMVLERHFVADHCGFARPGSFVQGSRVLLGPELSARLMAGEEPALNLLTPGMDNRKNRLRLPLAVVELFSRPARPLSGIRTCNFAFWRKDALAVNGFNQEFEGWGREDSEFAARLLNRGLARRNLRFAGVAYHLHHPVQSRERLAANDAILARTVAEKLTWCQRGIRREEEEQTAEKAGNGFFSELMD